MKDLYDRLQEVGYDPKFVRECVLPDWWSDDMASVPANRAMAEIAIARHFGFRIANLRNSTRPLTLPRVGDVRLKRRAGTTEKQVAPAVSIARRAAELVVESIDLPSFGGPALASAVRAAILRHSAHVDLRSLMRYCWSHGIPVVPLARIPSKSKKIDGLATYVADRPVIVLDIRCDSPPWIAFRLAHEFGHIMRQHVHKGGELLVDHDIDRKDVDEQEQEADRFACELLTGEPEPKFAPGYGLTGPKLAGAALRYGEQRRVAPGTVVLIYGRTANRWGPAQKALQFLGQDFGAREQVLAELRRMVDPHDLAETTERFLSGCVGLTD